MLARVWRRICAGTLGLAALVLAGCLDYEEEIWLERDGSGRATISVRVVEQLATLGEMQKVLSEDAVRERMTGLPGITVQSVTRRVGKRTLALETAFTFDSIPHLEAALAAGNEGGFRSPNTLSFIEEDGSPTYRRTVRGDRADLQLPQAGDPTGGMAQAMVTMMFANHYLTYRLHTPFPVVASDGTVAPDGLTVEWKFPLIDVLDGDLRMHAQLKPPLPWTLMGAAGAGIIVLLALALAMRRQRAESALPIVNLAAPVPPPAASPPARPAPLRHTRENDVLWLSDAARVAGIKGAAVRLLARGAGVIVSGYNGGALASVAAALTQTARVPVTLLEPHELKPTRFAEVAAGAPGLFVLLVGAPADPEGEQKLLEQCRELACDLRLQVHHSLDDHFFNGGGMRKVRVLLEGLTATPNEPIRDPLVASAIADARRRRAG